MFRTNDIKIEFSSQIGSDGLPIVYNVVSGSTITECFNETLDSAAIVLDHIPLEKRLVNIQPYQWVRVYDVSTEFNSETKRYAYDRFFLIDNYFERENNISEHIFSYTINLFSETKLLEKIQCPNLIISHKVENGATIKKTIFDYICQYMTLYCPKIKTAKNDESWDYDYLIKWNSSKIDSNPLYVKFNVDCADISITAGTLRQVLSRIMQQVGCIPAIKDRKLSFLDLTAEATDFAINGDYSINNTVNSLQRSLSSDSYANTLVSMQSNVYSPASETISESLGFRDSSNLIIKQTENLKLNTRFPIYKINSFHMNIPCECSSGSGNLEFVGNTAAYSINSGDVDLTTNEYGYVEPDYTNRYTPILYQGNLIFGGTNFLDFDGNVIATTSITGYPAVVRINLSPFYGDSWRIENFKLHFVKWSNIRYKEIDFFTCDPFNIFYTSSNVDERFPVSSESDERKLIFVDFGIGKNKKIPENYDGYWIEYDVVLLANNPGQKTQLTIGTRYKQYLLGLGNEVGPSFVTNNFVQYYKKYRLSEYDKTTKILGTESYQGMTFRFSHSVDMTPLVVESSARATLNTNFLEMTDTMPIDEMSKYIYSTVGYSIGSTQISGFSQTYSKSNGWWEESHTYMENIYQIFSPSEKDLKESFNFAMTNFGDIPLILNDVENSIQGTINYYTLSKVDSSLFENMNFGFVTFDIKYIPINSFTINYTKKDVDVPFRIEQYNSTGDSLSEFSRMSENMQQQVDRIGNETISISQRIEGKPHTGLETIRPLNSYFMDSKRVNSDKYIVYKRDIAINNYFCNVSYIASKDSILKDYFTSIRTKYRAYANVDYSSSVLRKENDTVYINISEDGYYSGSDLVVFGNLSGLDNSTKKLYTSYLVGGLTYYLNSQNNIKINSVFEYGKAIDTENNNEDVYVAAKNELLNGNNEKSIFLTYQQFDNTSSGTYFNSKYLNESQEKATLGGIIQTWQLWNERDYKTIGFSAEKFRKGLKINVNNLTGYNLYGILPIVSEYDANLKYKQGLTNVLGVENETMFYINTNNGRKLFYQDPAEYINYTLEFDYYTQSKNFQWSSYFLQYCPFIVASESNAAVEHWDNIAVLNYSDDDTNDNEAKNAVTPKWFFGSSSGFKAKNDDISKFVSVQNDEDKCWIEVNWSDLDKTKWCEVVRYDFDISNLLNNSIKGDYVEGTTLSTDYCYLWKNNIGGIINVDGSTIYELDTSYRVEKTYNDVQTILQLGTAAVITYSDGASYTSTGTHYYAFQPKIELPSNANIEKVYMNHELDPVKLNSSISQGMHIINSKISGDWILTFPYESNTKVGIYIVAEQNDGFWRIKSGYNVDFSKILESIEISGTTATITYGDGTIDSVLVLSKSKILINVQSDSVPVSVGSGSSVYLSKLIFSGKEEDIPNTNVFYRTLTRFKYNGNDTQRFYLTLDDTRSKYIYSETESGLPYQKYEVAMQNSGPAVKTIKQKD